MVSRLPTRSVSAIVALTLSSLCGDARAQLCPAPVDAPSLADVDVETRLDYLARAFHREIKGIDIWSMTWGTAYTAGAIAEGVGLSVTRNHGTRTDLSVGIVATAFGAVSLYALPLKLTLPLRAARAHWSDSNRCEVLARAERTLVSVERDQAIANGPLAHIGNVAVNTAIVLVLGLGYGRWASAAISGGVGVAVGEANVLTQPHHLRDVLARYRTGQLEPIQPGIAWSVSPVVGRGMSGARLTLSW